MKPRTPPTSPKGKLEASEAELQAFLKQKEQFVKPMKPRSLWSILLLGVLGGLFSGLVGAVLLTSLALGNPGAPFWAWLGITLPEQREREVIVREEGTTTTIQELLSNIGPAVLAFSSQSGSLLARDVTGGGLVISSDGYAVSVDGVSTTGSTHAVLSPTHIVPTDGVPADDTASPLLAFRVTSDNLTVTTIAAPESVTTGDALIVVRRTERGTLAFQSTPLVEAHVLPRDDGALLSLSSEVFTRRHIITPLGDAFLGAPVFTMGGEAIGLVADPAAGIVMPLDTLRPALDRLLTTGAFDRVRLGVRYQDLAWMPDVRTESERPKSGALLAGDSERGIASVAQNSPAEAAGLQDGDRITAVNDAQLTAPEQLTTTLQRFSIGETVTLTFIREGTEQTVDVTLGSP